MRPFATPWTPFRLAAPLLFACLMTTPSWADSAGSDRSLQRVRRTQIQAKCAAIDALLEGALAQAGVQPNERCSDEIFLRRIYLDAIGRIPTADEAQAFLDCESPDKRADLIDELLASEGYVSHQFNYFADLLRATSRMRRGPGKPYLDWIKRSLQNNKPYDQFVRELITAEGNILEPDTGAVGYYLRDTGMIEDNMSNTVRVFLGTRLECAQCHDHPYDDWTQKQYMEMVAFTAGIKVGNYYTREERKEYQRLIKQHDMDKEMQRAYRRVNQPLTYAVGGPEHGLYRLPKDYQYSDGKPNEEVKATTIFGDSVDLAFENAPKPRRKRPANAKAKAEGKSAKNQRPPRKYKRIDLDSRAAYAQWMTAPDNPRFTTVIANRLWKRAMGVGLIEPVDDIRDITKAADPALMAYLEKQMICMGYDLKQFYRMLYNTRHYQRTSISSDRMAVDEGLTAGPLLRRMSAEQLWDSLATFSVPNIDDLQWETDTKVYDDYQALKSSTVEEKIELAEAYQDRVKNPEKYRALRRKKSRQAAQAQKKAQKTVQTLYQQYKKARASGDEEMIMGMSAEIEEMGFFLDAKGKLRNGRSGYTKYIKRASELNSPERGGHLLRQFGQSDRQQIEATHRDASVTQILNLLNGYVDTRVINTTSTLLLRKILQEEDPVARIKQIYLSTYTRHPTPQEMNEGLRVVKANPRHGYQDLIWTQINSLEFLFIQ
ncbi:MAG: DUF1549 domain-containing protein [Planctomycetes bacterium]|nr:DUF1549 domain-containing protein [Planctomycetota bacterium]